MRVWTSRGWSGTPANCAPHEHDQIGWFTEREVRSLHLADDAYRGWIAEALSRDAGRSSSTRVIAGALHSLTGIVESRSVGAVRPKVATPMAITQKAAPATILWARLAVKRSSKIQTLRTMATAGSTTTIRGWETLNGPTCKAACWSTEPTIAVQSMRKGQCSSVPTTPDTASMLVASLMKAAIKAHEMEAAMA